MIRALQELMGGVAKQLELSDLSDISECSPLSKMSRNIPLFPFREVLSYPIALRIIPPLENANTLYAI